MKYIVSAVLVLLCFPFGQLAHKFVVGPYYEDKFAEERQRIENQNRVDVEVAGPGGKVILTVDLREVKEEEIPEKVTLTKRVQVSSKDGTSLALESGTSVIVKGREGDELLIAAMSGPLEGRTKITSTDLPRRIANARAAELFGVAQVDPDGNQPPAPQPPAPQPPAPQPPVVAQNPPGVDPPAPTPTPAPTPPAPEPTPPAPEPAPTAAKLTPEQIEAVMQANIKEGGVKEFKFEDVKGWKAGEEEDVDGETYQTGMAAYQAETIFGPKTVQAKALIKDGKIVKWVYAKTGMEIR